MPVLFKTFDYSIATSAITTTMKMMENYQPDKQMPLVNIKINFEEGIFKLEGDWHFMMASNKHAEQGWLACHKQRVSIDAVVFPNCAIDLSDGNNDGLVFAIDGCIHDGDNRGTCSGLLILDKLNGNSKTGGSNWNISFYLYDNANDDCEITFKIPVYAQPADGSLN